MNQTHGSNTHVVDRFEATDLGAPFKVVLHKCVKVTEDNSTGEIINYTIPDPDGLLRMVALARILNRRKLSGGEIKFLRKAVGLMQKEVSKGIDLSVEHLSKCESGKLTLSPSSEKLFRVFIIKTAIKHHKMKDCDAKRKIEEFLDNIFDEAPLSAFSMDDELEFHFSRAISSARADNDDDSDVEYQIKDCA